MARAVAKRGRRVGPSAKQVTGVPDFASSLLVPAQFTPGVEPAVSDAGLFLGHSIPSSGGMVCYYPSPRPSLRGQIYLGAEFCADDEAPGVTPLYSLCWRWLSHGGQPREIYTEPLAATGIVSYRVPIPSEQVPEDLAFTVTLKVSPISGLDMLLRAAWFEVRP